MVRSQDCGYWCLGAIAPGHQYPQCWLIIHCIGQVSYKKILHIRWTASENEITFWIKGPSHLRVKQTMSESGCGFGNPLVSLSLLGSPSPCVITLCVLFHNGNYPLNTWHNNNVVITWKRRHFDVITSRWRRVDVKATSLLRNMCAGYLPQHNIT